MASVPDSTHPLETLTRNEDPPFGLPSGVEQIRDVVYGQGGNRELRGDLFVPSGDGSGRPGIVFVHGGGWRGGTRTQFRRHAVHMATLGWVGLCIEYRLSGEAPFPAAVEDCKCAVRWMRARADQYGIDPAKLAAVGGSAGGHLASMLGVTDASVGLEGAGWHSEQSSKAAAVVSFNGVSDMKALVGHRGAIAAAVDWLGGMPDDVPDLYALASPITHVDTTSAPFLFLHGDADTTVPIEQSLSMKDRLKHANVRTEIFVAEGAGHGFFNRSPWYEPTLERMAEFLLDVLTGRTSRRHSRC